MPTYQLLTDRTLAQSSAITPTTLIHIVYTGDPSQNIAGSSYKAELQQLSSIFSGGTDTLVTGGTYSAGTITFTNSSGGTFPVTGLTEPFTGGTVSGATNFTNGLTANTISATTYLNIPVPTLNQVLIQGNQTLGEDIILNDMDSIINTGNTIGIQYKTGDTMYQYVTNNVDKTTEISLDKEYITLNSTNNDDGWEVELQLDGQNGQMFETVSNSVGTSLSRTTRQAGSIGDYCGNSTNTDYSSVNQKDDQISSIIVSGSSEVTKWELNNNQISGSTTNGVNTTLISLTPNNFRVETDNNQNIFFVDGTNNRVGISTNTPTEKLTVSGNTNITGTLNIGTIGAGTPLINLGLDSSGNVVTGTTGGGTFTGGTVNGATNFTNGLTANTISASTLFVNGVQITGDTYVTGMTFNTGNYNLTIGRNDGVSFTNNLGILASDLTITGGTYNSFTGVGTFTNNTGGTFNVTGFLVGYTDTLVTGSTYNNNTFTFTNSTGGTFDVSFNTVTGLTSTGLLSSNTISATTYQNLPQFSGGSGNCITDLYVTNIHGCSPITIYDSIRSTGSTVSGQSSISFGFQTSATTDYSHAEGESTLASGYASHSEGYQTSATTLYSHAEGDKTIASGFASHAEGSGTTATQNYSHAEGFQTKSSGIASHTEGYQTSATTQFSHSEGYLTKATGDGSHSEGNRTTSSGDYSHAEGYQTNSTNFASHSEGWNTTSSGTYSHAEGRNTNASGDHSHAEGRATISSGQDSHSEGETTQAIGVASHAEGLDTRAIGDYSHVEGRGTISSGLYQHVSGRFNSTGDTTPYAFIIGNGVSTSSRSNLFFAAGSSVLINGTLSATTISATTYQNLPDNVTGRYLPLSGGTVTGATTFLSGLTANTLNVTGTTTQSGAIIRKTKNISIPQLSPNYNILDTDNVIYVTLLGATVSRTVTLPTITASNDGRVITLVYVSTASLGMNLSLVAAGGNTINGSSSKSANAIYETITVIANNSANRWYILNEYPAGAWT